MTSIAERLSRVLGPLRRSLLRATERAGGLPDLPEAQIEMLRALVVMGPSTPGAVASELGLARSTVSNLVSAMGAHGLVERESSPHDARSSVLTVSPRAIDLLARYDDASARLLDEVLAGLTAADRARLEAALPVLARLAAELSTRTR